MAPKTGPSLKELMKNRNKASSPKDKNKSKPPINPPPPPPPQIPADLGLKLNPDIRKKRHIETAEEGELGLSKGVNSPGNHKTTRTEGPTLWIIERNLRWPKYVGPHVLGHPCWR